MLSDATLALAIEGLEKERQSLEGRAKAWASWGADSPNYNKIVGKIAAIDAALTELRTQPSAPMAEYEPVPDGEVIEGEMGEDLTVAENGTQLIAENEGTAMVFELDGWRLFRPRTGAGGGMTTLRATLAEWQQSCPGT